MRDVCLTRTFQQLYSLLVFLILFHVGTAFLSQRYTLLPRRAHLKHVAFENTYLWWQVDLSVIHSCCTFSFMPGLRSFYSTCFSVLWCPLNTKWLGLGGRKARSLKDQGLKQKEMLSQAFVFVLSTLFFFLHSTSFSAQSRWCLVSQHRYCSTLGLLSVLYSCPDVLSHTYFYCPLSTCSKAEFYFLICSFLSKAHCGVTCKKIYELVLQ